MWRVIFGFLLTACESTWEIKDHDGDGQTLLDGDCWNSLEDPVPPENALDHGVTAAQIYQGAEDLPYDGIDANCDGLDDFDQDGDGFVPAEFAGVITLGVSGSGALQPLCTSQVRSARARPARSSRAVGQSTAPANTR